MTDFDIRPVVADDIPHLKTVLDETGLFPPDMLEDLMAPALSGETGEFWLAGCIAGVPAGLCYTKREELAEGAWNMLALGVRPGCQRDGLGLAIVKGSEAHLRTSGERLLIVETSGTEDFAAARAFYASAGYEREACIRDFWATGDDKVVFRKLLG
ncbi:GNAT family N-acetyltransferase [Roseobacter ponti]|uniref:GNAT family N-acetyltransferase n=1 Tax=Roseobacter ponti TaxID=1891787 RepID=A0A858SZX1_9RHOB|nr:GNAT family N-acetyltransferase [Roseobacter ponti]QJF53041.1 GNAT family N-acetyltransferase [Roseobacter ponti]